ncbi:MAG: DHH family phosphoesterase [Proteobacteria bacterium]|nr:DHH family phosphoesterase [Pseudomonadota bacterium]
MAKIDVFNGDADGICALHQLRLAQPGSDRLVTGAKRDIRLLERVEASTGDEITVLDISLDPNRPALLRLLDAGARVSYFDHHYAGEVPAHPNLQAHIDTAADVCTSIIVDRHLNGRFRPWAVAAAFGDNLVASAQALAHASGYATERTRMLAALGECLNYNGYGDTPEDLHVHPAELYSALRPFADPGEFVAASPVYARLAAGFRADLSETKALAPVLERDACRAWLLPDAPWARRVSGVFANRLVSERPEAAHAVLTPDAHGSYTVSVRAPLDRPDGADALCRQFANGGGRKAAAGINRLPAAEVDDFLRRFGAHFSGRMR